LDVDPIKSCSSLSPCGWVFDFFIIKFDKV
jgi:hypothetical protein